MDREKIVINQSFHSGEGERSTAKDECPAVHDWQVLFPFGNFSYRLCRPVSVKSLGSSGFLTLASFMQESALKRMDEVIFA